MIGMPDVAYRIARRAAVPLSESARRFLALVASGGAARPGSSR